MKIVIYSTETGRVPFLAWLDELDEKTRTIVYTRIDRIKLGNFGDSKPIKNGNGIRELRISYGPGYRVYFALRGTTIVILLFGGNKASQQRDITKAKQYWLKCKELSYE